MKKKISFIAVTILSFQANANDVGTLESIDAIDNVLGIGGGLSTGIFSTGSDDDWVVFGANIGDVLSFTISGVRNNYILFQSNDGSFDIGDVANISNFNNSHIGEGVDMTELAQYISNGTFSFTAGYSGQYAFGIKSVNDNNSGGSWSINITGNTLAVPEPISFALFGLGLAGFGFSRKKIK